MNLLVKLPSRERPARLQDAVLAMLNKATHRPGFLIAVDEDDRTVPYYWLNTVGAVVEGPRVSKIEACNRGLSGHWKGGALTIPDFDIVVLASDDMLCQVQGWDEIIRQDMATHFPDTDGCLWYPDGHQDRLCTLPVMGRAWFNRFGYIYHPSYKSLWADNEQHQVAEGMGKLWRSDRVLFRHMHPAWGTAKKDALYTLNESLDRVDRINFDKRKAAGFPP